MITRPVLLALLATSCTTIHSAGGGARPGEFYVAAEKTIIPVVWTYNYVLRCMEVRDPMGVELHCTRVMRAFEAGKVSPETGREVATFVRMRRADEWEDPVEE